MTSIFAKKHVVLLAIAVISANCSKARVEDKDDEDTLQTGTGRYVSQYDWQRITNARLPALIKNQEASLALTTSSERCVSSAATSFKRSFSELAKQVLTVPQVKLCNGADVEFGITYKEVNTGIDQGSSVFRFEERDDLGVSHINCTLDGALNSAVTYKFGDGDTFRTEYFYTSSFVGESSSYGLFDKSLADANEILTRYVSVSDGQAQAFSARYSLDGTGRSSSDFWNTNEQSTYSVLFADIGGGAYVKSQYEAETNVWREHFDSVGRRVSSLELKDLDLSVIEEATPASSKDDSRFAIPEGITGLSCGEQFSVIECTGGIETIQDVTTNNSQRDCPPESSNSLNKWDIIVKDRWDRRDPYVTIVSSLGSASSSSATAPGIGDIFGMRASLEKGDLSVVDISAQLELELNGMIEIYQPTACDGVDDSAVGGVVTSNEDACRLARSYPLLLKVEKAGNVKIPIVLGSHTATFEIDIKK